MLHSVPYVHPEPIGQQGRWLDFFGEYDITVQHHPGRVHGNSDALSWRPCERSLEMDSQQCRWATPTLAAEPISCDALSADGTTVLLAPLCFLPLHSQTDKSSDLSLPNSPLDIASDLLEAPELLVLPSEAPHASRRMTSWHSLRCSV